MPIFFGDFILFHHNLLYSCPELVPRDTKPALGAAYSRLMTDIWRGPGGPGYVPPTGVLHAVKQAWPAFRGFQQHDAQVRPGLLGNCWLEEDTRN